MLQELKTRGRESLQDMTKNNKSGCTKKDPAHHENIRWDIYQVEAVIKGRPLSLSCTAEPGAPLTAASQAAALAKAQAMLRQLLLSKAQQQNSPGNRQLPAAADVIDDLAAGATKQAELPSISTKSPKQPPANAAALCFFCSVFGAIKPSCPTMQQAPWVEDPKVPNSELRGRRSCVMRVAPREMFNAA